MTRKKPKLWGKIEIVINIVMSFIISIFGLLKLPENFNNVKILIVLLIIFIISFITIFIFCIIIYSIKLYLYCKDQDKYICELKKNIDGLNEERKNLNDELKKRFEIIKNLKNYTNDVLLTLEDIIKHLEMGILSKTKTEQKFLTKVHEIVCNKYNSMKRKGKEI